MISRLDHVVVAVTDLDKAEQDYQKVFGISPVWRGKHKESGATHVIFNFRNTYFDLVQANSEGLTGITLGTENIDATAQALKSSGYDIADFSEGESRHCQSKDIRSWQSLFLPPKLTRGISSFIIQHTQGQLPAFKSFEDSTINKLDHVVINTNDADGFIAVYRDVFKIRLALDKVIEHWQKRILFFRLNHTTIEVIEQKHDNEQADSLWGLAWEVKSLEKARERLVNEGVDVTPVKKGVKENTLVATIKSHTHSVPTLLIQHI